MENLDVDNLQMRLGDDFDCVHCCNDTSLEKTTCEKCNRKLITESGDDNAKAMQTKLDIEECTNCVNLVNDADIEKGTNDPESSSVQNCEQEMPYLDEILETTENTVELSPTLETDEKKVEELEEVKKSTELVENLEKNTKNTKDESSKTDDEICFLCPSCKHLLPSFGEDFTVELEGCNHILCRWCMTELLQSIINNTTVEPRCPYIVTPGSINRCNRLIPEHQIRQFAEPKLYESYLEKSIIKIKEDAGNKIVHCQTPACQAWYIMEDDHVDTFLCTLCNVNNYINKKDNPKSEESLTDTEKCILSERFNEMLLLSESNIVPNFETFECPVCFVQCEPREGMILKNCLHMFCKTCVANVVIYSEDVDIICPYKDDDYSCDQMILQSEMKAVLKPEEFQKYLQKSINKAEANAGKSAFHCKTPNCPDWCFYELGADHFLCPTCKQHNCFLCKKIHTGSGCIDNITVEDPDSVSKLSENVIDTMLQNGNALLCPKCNAVIVKIEGCDLVTCAACKTEICWATRGPRWGPAGRGDNSGGCMCNSYAKCHPNCRNCH